MIEWSDAAIEAALSAYWDKDWSGACQDANAVHRVNAMRVALDAAAQAQGEISDYHEGIVEGVKIGRAEAFEEAARVVDDLIENDPLLLPRVAAAIRALAKETGK